MNGAVSGLFFLHSSNFALVDSLEAVMTHYQVAFFNNLVSSNGRPFKCLQRAVTVSEAQDSEAAAEKAKREFERLENVGHWKRHATFFEIEG